MCLDEAKDFATNYKTIKENFSVSLHHFFAYFQHFGIHVDEGKINMLLEKSNIGDVLKNLASQASSQFSNLFMIMFMVAFMLMESQFFIIKC